ncbi:MAG: hypothetical protein AAFR22_02325 [Chloroflexota bacterium]
MPPVITVVSLIVLICGISLPWVHATGVSLQPGMLDFAEWLTLLPAVRSNLPLMLPALLVRISIVLAVWVIALYSHTLRGLQRWLVGAVVFVLAFALLPPVDFFRGAFDDSNYQQQFVAFALAGLAIAALLPPLNLQRNRFYVIGTAVLAGLSMALAVAGFVWGYDILVRYEVTMRVGAGIFLYGAGLLLIAVTIVLRKLTQTAEPSHLQ